MNSIPTVDTSIAHPVCIEIVWLRGVSACDMAADVGCAVDVSRHGKPARPMSARGARKVLASEPDALAWLAVACTPVESPHVFVKGIGWTTR